MSNAFQIPTVFLKTQTILQNCINQSWKTQSFISFFSHCFYSSVILFTHYFWIYSRLGLKFTYFGPDLILKGHELLIYYASQKWAEACCMLLLKLEVV